MYANVVNDRTTTPTSEFLLPNQQNELGTRYAPLVQRIDRSHMVLILTCNLGADNWDSGADAGGDTGGDNWDSGNGGPVGGDGDSGPKTCHQ